MKDRVAIIVSAVTAVIHLAFANRYDVFRDELYFIVCGRHPAFGYADQPPLVPLLAAATYGLGAQTWLLRLPAVLAAAGLVWLVIAFVRLLRGGDGAAWTAGIAAAVAPMFMGLTSTLTTTTFELVAWTGVAYGIARALLLNDRRALIWTGLGAGLAMEAKYALPLWLAGIALGVLCGPERELFRRRELWIGIATATLVALPSVLWQAVFHWPFVELVRNAGEKDVAVAPLAFALNQVFVLNPLLAPLWIAGILAPFTSRSLRPMRFVSIAFVFCAVAIVVGHGKDYYLAPAYPALLAVGAVACERLLRSAFVRAAYLTAVVAFSVVAAPMALPILNPPALLAYERALHVAPQQQERGDAGGALPSTFGDMLGWHDFVRQVGSAYDALSPADRAGTAIVVDNYGEAAALDVYGAPYRLPPALSGHNQYYYWGTRDITARNVLRVQDDPEKLAPYCVQMRVVDTTESKYARRFENGKAIAFCRGLHPPLQTIWPSLRMLI